MRPRTSTARIIGPLSALLLLAACADDGDTSSSVELEGTNVDSDSPTDGAEDGPADEVTSTEPAEDEGDAEPADTETDADAGGSSDLVDMSEAVPGSWPVGDAGTVTFAIADAALVLEDVAAADGWRADVDEQDPDEIEIELEDGGTIAEIEIDQDSEPADPGSYDIGEPARSRSMSTPAP